MTTDRRKILVLSLVGALLSMPLLLDMMFGFSAATDPINGVTQLCWLASLLVGIFVMIKAWRARENMSVALFCLLVPVLVIVLGWLPIWPVFAREVHTGL